MSREMWEDDLAREWQKKRADTDLRRRPDHDMLISAGTERILFVDNEAARASVVQKQLEHFGYDVTTSGSSSEVLMLVRTDPTAYDLIVSDVKLSGMNGADLIREIKRICPDIPIVVCAGSFESLLEAGIEESSVDELLLKPFTMHEISGKIRSVLNRKRRGGKIEF